MSTSIEQLAKQSNLTHAQLMVWLGQSLQPEVPLYNMPLAFEIEAPFSIDHFQTAFQSVVRRSDSLRSIVVVESGVPQRRVRAEVKPVIEIVDFSNRNFESPEVTDWLEERCGTIFDLTQCMFDCVVLKLANGRHVWLMNQHHLITDGWSAAILLSNLQQAYQNVAAGTSDESALPEFELFSASEREFRLTKRFEKAIEHWQGKNDSNFSPVPFYGSLPQNPSSRSKRIQYQLSRDQSDKLRQLAARPDLRSLSESLTLYSFFATLIFSLLHRLSGKENLAVGSPASNRSSKTAQATLGLFVELFPLQIEFSKDETFVSLLKKVQKESTSFLLNAQTGTSSPELHRCFNVVLNYINTALPRLTDSEMTTHWLHCGHSDAAHHLRLEVHDFDSTGQFHLLFDVNQDVFDPQACKWLVDHFQTTADAFLEDVESLIQRIDLGQPVLEHQADSANRWVPTSSTVLDVFETQVRQNPNAIAVADQTSSLTYQQLNDQSQKLAFSLIENHNVQSGQVVGVIAERTVDMIVAVLGTMMSGAAYLPLDPAYPTERVNLLVGDSSAKLILAPGRTDLNPDGVVCPLVQLEDALAKSLPSSLPSLSPTDLAYFIYTSGTTGSPNGVQVEHRNIVSLVDGLRERIYSQYSTPLNVGLVAPMVFDASVQQVFGALLQGHCLHVVPESARMNGQLLREFLEERSIAIIDGTPAHLQLLTEEASNQQLPQHFILGGDTMLAAQVNGFYERVAPQTPKITNIYGVAECCVDSCSFEVTPETICEVTGAMPIGKPLRHNQIMILNSAGLPQPVGVAGEIVIAGEGVSRGYMNRPSLNSAKFVQHPTCPDQTVYRTGDIGRYDINGNLHFLGRSDNQVKVRGIRIECGEIEHQLKGYTAATNSSLKVIQPNEPAQESKRCNDCVLTSNYPGVEIGNDGICNVCREWEDHQGPARAYFKDVPAFESLIEQANDERPNKQYDCMLLYSGGKDSSYVLHRLVELGLRVLAFTFDNGFISQAAFENIRRQTTMLGVDCVIEQSPQMNEVFVESLNQDATVCSGCFKALTAISTKLAHEHDINVVVTGLSRGQIFDTKLSGLFRQGIVETPEVEDNLRMFRRVFHANDDRTARLLGVDLQEIALEEIHFVDFFRYDQASVMEVRTHLKSRDDYWNQPQDTGFCSSNCLMNDVGICVHSSKRGYHNYEGPLSWDVRLGISSRDEVLSEVSHPVNLRSTEKILDRIGFFEKRVGSVRVLADKNDQGQMALTAYFTANQKIKPEKLRSFLADKIPSYMIPAKFVQVEQMPLTAHGKVDDRALRAERVDAEPVGPRAAPRNELETKLTKIWQDVLRAKQIGIHDNYFDLGGDSIGAIRIVAQAGRADISITASQLLAKQTVAELASVAIQRQSLVDQKPVVGPVLLNPVQTWFLEESETAIPLVSQVVCLRLPYQLDVGNLEKSVGVVLEHHDALRTAFNFKDGQWEAAILSPSETAAIQICERETSESLSDNQLDEWIVQLNRQLDPQSAQHLAIGLVRYQNGTCELVLLVHHLVMDAMSWPALLEDLLMSHQAISKSEQPDLPLKTTSIRDWTEALADHAQSSTLRQELGHWKESLAQSVGSIPCDQQPSSNAQADCVDRTIRFDASVMATLKRASAERSTRIQDCLLAALAATIAKWSQTDTIQIDIEGHGRDSFDQRISVDRTIGWFTNIYPVQVNAASHTPEGILETLRSAQSKTSSIPCGGIGFGALKYLNRESESSFLRTAKQSEILFNYFGQGSQLMAVDAEAQIRRELALWRGSEVQRRYLLEVNAMIVGDELCVTWTYNNKIHNDETIDRLTSEFRETLSQLLEVERKGGGSPSCNSSRPDFSSAGLDAAQMNQLAAMLKNVDSGKVPQ